MKRSIRPSLSGSIWSLVVGAFSIALLAIGLSTLAATKPDMLRVLVAGGLGAYGLWNVLQTPLSLNLRDGEVVLVGLLTRRARAKDLDRVLLTRGGMRRPYVWRFLLKDGSVAFETDAGLWRPDELHELMHSAGVRMEPRA